MWKWLQAFRAFFTPLPAPPLTEALELQAKRFDAHVKHCDEVLEEIKQAAVLDITAFFVWWFPHVAAKLASLQSDVTVSIADRIPALKEEINDLVRKTAEIVDKVFGNDTLWAWGAIKEFHYSREVNLKAYHPVFGSAIWEIEQEFWRIVFAAGYAEPEWSMTWYSKGSLRLSATDLPQVIDDRFKGYRNIVGERRRFAGEAARCRNQLRMIEAQKLWDSSAPPTTSSSTPAAPPSTS